MRLRSRNHEGTCRECGALAASILRKAADKQALIQFDLLRSERHY